MNKRKKNWKNILVVVCVVCTVLSFSAGCSIGKNAQLRKVETKADKIRSIIDKNYLNDVDDDNVVDNVYKGILNGLDDPYSVYYTKKEYKDLQQDTQGTYVGIGVAVREDNDTGYIKVINSFENGPAYKKGIRDNDYITKVNGEDIKGKDINTVVTKIKGKEGTTVDITITRPSTAQTYTYTVERRSVDIPTVEHKMLDGQIGYIQVSEFDEVTYDQYMEALNDLEKQGEKGLIVDLRDNPGGLLDTVVKMLEQMLPKGKIVYTEDKYGKGDTYTCKGDHEFTKPLVVLVNENSASASEIFTGAIKDYGIGTIVGTKTFGKGIVQRIFPLNDGSALKLTVSKYYTPKGTCIHGKGIEPDVKIEYDLKAQDGDTYDSKKDNQLNKAISVIEEEIK